MVTDDDFIVDDGDSDIEFESGADEEDGGSAADSGADELWAEWAEGDAVEEKLRGVVKSKGRAAAAVLNKSNEEWVLVGTRQDTSVLLRHAPRGFRVTGVHSAGTSCSCKSVFAASLLKELHAKGHRTLIFSQSRVMLDIVGLELKQMKICYSRIDGTLSAARREVHRQFLAPAGVVCRRVHDLWRPDSLLLLPAGRTKSGAARWQARVCVQDLVQEFQGRTDIPVMLLTSQVGGLGLTLTAADRVIILDPAWNPATDDQSVDRAYRIGQSRDVVVCLCMLEALGIQTGSRNVACWTRFGH